MTVRVNLIHSKQIFLKKILQKINILKKKRNSASELHYSLKHDLKKTSLVTMQTQVK